MRRKNLIGWVLRALAAVSLVFGWPWGSLVGAILALAGVLALRFQPSQAPLPTPSLSTPLAWAQGPAREPSEEESERLAEAVSLAEAIKGIKTRGEPVPEELTNRAERALESGLDDWFQRYEALVSNRDEKTFDRAAFAQQIRSQYGWPSQGSVLGHPSASAEVDLVLTRIEDLGGRVSIREAIFLQAVLEDGPEAHYLKERQKRGYPSLFENEAHLEWSSDPGFYERQLQIRHNNAFFPPPKRYVSRNDLYIARRMDEEERGEFL
jgi:hypothetical protein